MNTHQEVSACAARALRRSCTAQSLRTGTSESPWGRNVRTFGGSGGEVQNLASRRLAGDFVAVARWSAHELAAEQVPDDVPSLVAPLQSRLQLVESALSFKLKPVQFRVDRLRGCSRDAGDAARERWVHDASRRHGISVCATNSVRYAVREAKPIYDVLHCIREGVTLDEAGRALAQNTRRGSRVPTR